MINLKGAMNKNKIYNKFKKNGYLIFPKFINSKHFNRLCIELNKDIEKSLRLANTSMLGGSLVGNLNLYPGHYGKKIFVLLRKKKFLNILENITKKKINNFSISVGGNLSLPKRYDQNFHTDGNFDQKMIIASLATSDICFNNGPTEIVLDNHKNEISYLKFLITKKRKKKILLKKGDLIIRKHSLWHRGTRNNSEHFRFLIAFVIFEKKRNIKSNLNSSKKIKIFSNFFGNSILERFKEFIYVYLNFIYVFYKICISIKKKI